MAVSAFDSAIEGGLFGDAEIAGLFADAAQVEALVRVEVALARVQAALGVIPSEAADGIARAAETFEPDLAALAQGMANAGVPIPALVSQLCAAVGGGAADWIHFGATSQDIVDTALVLRLRTALAILDQRLDTLIAALAKLAEAHRTTPMVARTRLQQALPTTFGLVAAGWLLPLVRHRERLAELRPRLLVVQLGGAAGTLAALGDRGVGVMEELARELDLGASPLPWHTQRDGLIELAGWLALVAGSLGKLGQDVALLAQSEVAELREGGEGRGGSSTLPQKANPVGAETLVALARFAAGLLGTLHQAALQEHQRGAAGWALEWLTLPQLVVATGAALRHAVALAAGLEVEAPRMRANLDASNGLVLAEAASFALAQHMARADARAIAKVAAREATRSGRHLFDVLAERTDAPIDWAALRDPKRHLGAAEALVERALAATRRR